MFQAISPVAKVAGVVADALTAMQPAMSTVPAPTGIARPSRGPRAPATSTPTSPAPSATAKTTPRVASPRPACVSPIRPLTPHREFCARDQHSTVTARTRPERRWGSGAVVPVSVPGAAGESASPPGRRPVSGHTASAVRAIAASGRPCARPRWGTVRYTAPASADTLSRPIVEARCGSFSAAIRVAATVVAVPDPKPPTTAPTTTAGTAVVSAAAP